MYDKELKRIIDASQNNALTFFVGAGISKLSGAPSWRDLIDAFCDEMGIPKKEKAEKYSSDELLKIPQVFYYSIHEDNDRYFQLIQSTLMSGLSCPNEIHDMMMKLHPVSYVTTNYDNLISEAAINNYQSYKVVASDQEVSTIFGDRFILKMHGDLQHRNVVLKEEDYLNYSENYKLIETMVKSIFATNTVVFIGYGINDYNIKLILNWAKALLKDGFRTPIFVYTDKEPLPDEELTYYESRGLSVIESVKLAPETATLKYIDRYKAVFLALNAINRSDPFEGENAQEAFNTLYDLLRPLDKLNALRLKDVTERIGPEIRIDENGVIQRHSESNVLNRFFEINKALEKKEESFTKEEIEKYSLILNVFRKARINTVMEDKGLRCFIQSDIPFADKTCLSFDYKAMLNFVSQCYDSLTDKYIKAYYLSRLFRYDEAIYLFNEVAKKSYSNRDYLLFYLAESNCIILHKVIKNINQWYKCYDEEKIDSLSLDDSDVKTLFEQLPTEFQNEYKSLGNLHSSEMLYRFSYDAFTCGQKLQQSIESNSTEWGVTSAGKAISQINNFTHFLLGNGISVDVFDEYKNAIRYLTAILVYKISVQDKASVSPAIFPDFLQNKVQFDQTDFYNFIECFKGKEIVRLFAKHKLKSIEFVDNMAIEKSINNLIDYYEYAEMHSSNRINLYSLENRIKTCMTLTHYLRLSQRLVDRLVSFMLSHDFREILISEKLMFLHCQIHQRNMYSVNTDKAISQRLFSYLDDHISALQKGKPFEAYSTTRSNYPNLIAYIQRDSSDLFEIELRKRVTRILRGNFTILYPQIVNFYSKYITKSQKRTLIRKIKSNLAKNFSFPMISLLISLNAKVDQKMIECLVKHLKSEIKQERAKSETGVKFYPAKAKYHDLSQVGLWCYAKVLPKEAFAEFIGINAEFDFYCQYQNFDFGRFDVSWVFGWTDYALKAFTKNWHVKHSICRIISNRLMDNDLIPSESERLCEIMQKYFI